jgi:hypothetical protein
MTRRTAMFLRVFGGWTVFVWVVFIRNVVRDGSHSTAFKVVHITLAVISLAFAAATFVVVSRSRRAATWPPDDAVSAGITPHRPDHRPTGES